MSDEPIVLARFGDPVRAELAREKLVEAGIPARLGNFEASEMISAPATNGVELLVPSSEVARAREVLAEVERDRTDPAARRQLDREAMATPKPPEATEET
jgi:hypothetical protein